MTERAQTLGAAVSRRWGKAGGWEPVLGGRGRWGTRTGSTSPGPGLRGKFFAGESAPGVCQAGLGRQGGVWGLPRVGCPGQGVKRKHVAASLSSRPGAQGSNLRLSFLQLPPGEWQAE